MKHTAKLLSFFSAICFAFVSSSSAQLQTYETQTLYTGSTITFNAGGAPLGGDTLGQTFSNVSAVASMTYNFFTASSTAGDNLTAVFGQWNAGTESFIGGTTVSFGTINIPASNTWTETLGANATFEYEFDLLSLSETFPSLIDATYGYLTSSSSTYALMLTNTGGPTNLALGQTNTNAFAYGQAYLGGGEYSRDWTFSQIVVAPGNQNIVPIPESSTVAALLGTAFVAGLVGFRVRQRRQLALVPVAAA